MIICGTNFTAHANHAALAAAALAARLKGTLTLAHVLDPSLYSDPSPDLLEHLRNARRNKLANLAERTVRRGARIEFCLAEGSPGESLARVALGREARLLVLGSAGQVDPGKWCTGSVLDHAVESAAMPILVVRDADSLESWAQNDRPMRIVVGYDFSPASEAALHWAASLKEIAPCEVTVVYVASSSGHPTMAAPISPVHYPSALRFFLKQELERQCDLVLGQEAHTVYVEPDWGMPGAQLIESASNQRADLFVAGASQRRGLARFRSTSRNLLHYAPMNIACVPFPRHSFALAGGPHDSLSFPKETRSQETLMVD